MTDGIKLDNSVLVPTEFTHSIRALESGTVKVTGTPYDETAGLQTGNFYSDSHRKWCGTGRWRFPCNG